MITKDVRHAGRVSRDSADIGRFLKRWNDALNTMSAASSNSRSTPATISPFNAEVGYSITYKTVLAGDIQRNIVMR
jgi:hypothetical protein